MAKGAHSSTPALSYVILGILAETPMHGYDLLKTIQGDPALALLWRFKTSLLYANLEKLEKEGLLESYLVENLPRPSRREFQLTEKGKKVLAEWLITPVMHSRDMRQEFLTKLYFIDHIDRSKKNALFTLQGDHFGKLVKSLRQKMAASQADSIEYSIFEFRVIQIDAIIEWLQILATRNDVDEDM